MRTSTGSRVGSEGEVVDARSSAAGLSTSTNSSSSSCRRPLRRDDAVGVDQRGSPDEMQAGLRAPHAVDVEVGEAVLERPRASELGGRRGRAPCSPRGDEHVGARQRRPPAPAPGTRRRSRSAARPGGPPARPPRARSPAREDVGLARRTAAPSGRRTGEPPLSSMQASALQNAAPTARRSRPTPRCPPRRRPRPPRRSLRPLGSQATRERRAAVAAEEQLGEDGEIGLRVVADHAPRAARRCRRGRPAPGLSCASRARIL